MLMTYMCQRLLEWRDSVGIELDESPAYVCSSVMLLKIAEQKPFDLEALYKVIFQLRYCLIVVSLIVNAGLVPPPPYSLEY